MMAAWLFTFFIIVFYIIELWTLIYLYFKNSYGIDLNINHQINIRSNDIYPKSLSAKL